MEVIGIISGVMGIISFIAACIEMYKRFRGKLSNLPDIVHRIISELKAAKVLMERASRVMKRDFPYDQIIDINTMLTICEKCVRKLSVTAERVEGDAVRGKQFPKKWIPELQTQREELGDSVLNLTSELRLLEW